MSSVSVSTVNHPALRAWQELSGDGHLPASALPVEESAKSSIYRLVGAGADGTSVIAKRSPCAVARVERVIYQDVLPLLPVPSLHYYGNVAEANGEFCWLFIEDVSRFFRPRPVEQYRPALSRWLATLHTASSRRLSELATFPVRSGEYFLQRVRSTRISFLERLAGAHVADRERVVLERFVQQCDHLEASWHRIEDLCGDLPQCLVHGDMADENVGIRSTATGVQILAFDWEKAGWGDPTIDLTEADLDVYHSSIKEAWPQLSMVRLADLQRCGRIFSVFSRNLGPKPEEKLERNLRRLQSAMREMGIPRSSDGGGVTRFGVTDHGEVMDHPATRTWLALDSSHRTPESVSMLHAKPDKSTVYRLAAAGPSRESVIAKHTGIGSAQAESLIYECVLAELAISTPRYFGTSLDSTGESAWLFVEDAGERRFDRGNADHQILAARWLAGLHTATERLRGDLTLPVRTHSHYRDILETARQKIGNGMENPVLSDQHLDVLRTVLVQLERIDDSWQQIESFCEQMPMTLMHGDFVEKNLRVRQKPRESTLFVFDWESAAYGVPAQDLADVDAAVYFSAVQPAWPYLTEMDVRRLAKLGKVFWTLRLVDWASDNLSHAWPERAISEQLAYYEVWLREAFQAFRRDT